ncbi:MAG: DUF3168 domain-containing protein [Actinobacteria bacterium]|nr:DUF3168 domain-containing protein [Actinomycetota bacterium]
MTAPTAASPAIPIQQGIYELLTGDATLDALVTGVFDHVPEGVDKPYVRLDESLETPDNAHGSFGSITVQTLRIWTRARGHREGLTIEARIRALLDHRIAEVDAVVTGHRVVAVRFEQREAIVDPEPPGDIRHIAVAYRITTQQE